MEPPEGRGFEWFQCGSNFAGRRTGAALPPVTISSVTTRVLTAAKVASMLGLPKSWVYEPRARG